MNKKGQTLILFVIFIPLFLVMMAFVVDIGTIIYENIHAKELAKTIILESMNKDEEFVLELCRKNNLNEENLNILIGNDQLTIKNEYEIDSIFGSIIGIKRYKIKVNIIGIKKENKIIFE